MIAAAITLSEGRSGTSAPKPEVGMSPEFGHWISMFNGSFPAVTQRKESPH
jgi:hypothetical protein